MKNIYLRIGLFLFILAAFKPVATNAAGNLEFNQVLTFTGAIYGSASSPSTSTPVYTVPPGKVWKIESRTLASNPVYFYLNSTPIEGASGYMIYGTSDGKVIWLKAGDQIYYYVGYGSFNYYISIIEFNVIQN